MNSQENFELAADKASSTLTTLLDANPVLSRIQVETLQAWKWDLEAVVAALESELASRSDQPVDFG